MSPDLRRAGALALVMMAASAFAVAITPRNFLADQHPREPLSQIVPRAFGAWRIDDTVVPLPPSPDLQQVIDATYDETLALTYRDREGHRAMLSLAYGRNQHKGMNTHRPEVCYPAQGFEIVAPGERGVVPFRGRKIAVTRVVAAMAARNEPITYWLLVGDEVTHFGYPQRWVTIRYGIRGVIPDGILVRVSSIDADAAAAFAVQERFINDLLAGIVPSRLPRLLGSH